MNEVHYNLSFYEHVLICRGLEALIRENDAKLSLNIHPFLKDLIFTQAMDALNLFFKITDGFDEKGGDSDV